MLASQTCLIWKISRGPVLGFLRILLSERAARIPPPDFLGGLRSCCRSFGFFPLVWQFFGLLLVPYSLFIAGILQSYWMYCITTAIDAPGIIVLALCCYRLLTKKVSWDFLPCHLTAYFNGRLFSDYVTKYRLIISQLKKG